MLVPRETPLSEIHLENLLRLRRAGARDRAGDARLLPPAGDDRGPGRLRGRPGARRGRASRPTLVRAVGGSQMTLPPDQVRAMFDRIAPSVRPHEPDHEPGHGRPLARPGRALHRRRPGRRGARRVLRHRRPGHRAAATRSRRAGGSSASTSPRRCSTPPARKRAAGRVGARRRPRAAVRRRRVRRRHDRLRHAQPGRPPARASASWRRVVAPRRAGSCASRSPTRRRGRRRSRASGPTAPCPLLGRLVAREADAYRYLPASVHRFPPADELAAIMRRAGLRRGPLPAALGRRGRRACRDGPGMTAGAVAEVLEVPGPAAYVDAVEVALAEAVGWARRLGRRRRGRRDAAVGRQAAAADARVPVGARPGPRAAPAWSRPAARSSWCTWRRSSTTTSSTPRRCGGGGRRCGRRTASAVARATGDYLFARAFAELVRDRRHGRGRRRSPTPAWRSRGARSCSASRPATRRRRPSSTWSAAGSRPAACSRPRRMLGGRLGGLGRRRRSTRLGEFATALGLAFQIADDILDCDGRPDTTGKPLGTDLLDGTVTLPLILGARRDPAVAGVIARGAAPRGRAADARPRRPLGRRPRRPHRRRAPRRRGARASRVAGRRPRLRRAHGRRARRRRPRRLRSSFV